MSEANIKQTQLYIKLKVFDGTKSNPARKKSKVGVDVILVDM